MEKKIITLKAKKTCRRIDHFLKESLKDTSRSMIEKLMESGRVKLNYHIIQKKNTEIQTGDVVEIELTEPEKKKYKPSQELKKLFEDDFLLIIKKPPGISVHPGAGENQETILDIFRYYYPRINEIKDTIRPGIVHRLDKDTSGILVLAKDEIAMKKLQKEFKKRIVKKTYLGLIKGRMRYLNGTIDVPIKRSIKNRRKFVAVTEGISDKARSSVTKFSVIREFQNFSLVKLFPITGRTHQIRVHLSHYGNPVLGDRVYGRGDSFERLALHAYSIEFIHPISGNTILSYSPMPKTFRDFIKTKIQNMSTKI